MNIEIANRLFELRKKKNLSQEELAEKIGVSRQAVSKWERAESSPDTANLIELARLYEISLDDLLFTDEPVSQKDTEEKKDKKGKEFVSVGLDGIHVIEKDGSEVHVTWKGIKVKEAGEFDESWDEWDIDKDWDELKLDIKTKFWRTFPISIIVTAIYLMMGFSFNLWHPGWLVFFAIPIYYQTVGMCVVKGIRKKLNAFPIALLCVVTHLFIGLYLNIWHPTWILFLVIPLYYLIVNGVWSKKIDNE